jgi:hypothetical protein
VAELALALTVSARDQARTPLRGISQELTRVNTAAEKAGAGVSGLGGALAGIERAAAGPAGALGKLGGALGGLAQIGLAGAGLGAITSGIAGAVGAIGGLVTEASDLNEQLSRTDVVFGDAGAAVADFAKTAAQTLGISRTQALEAAGSFGTLFTASGLSQDAAAGMSTELVKLAADLASFNNIDPSEALDKLRSGLTGEAEPLRSVGVLLNENAVRTKALELGLGSASGELTEAAKVQARYALILDQTRTAQGDFARTSSSLANAQRIIKASFADLRTELGTLLLPAVARVASFLASQMPRALAAVQRVVEQLGPVLAAAFSGDLQGALDKAVALVGAAAALLAPKLAAWTQAFLAWVQEVVPPLLRALSERLGDLWAWIRETAPPVLERALAEWIPAFVRWVDEVGPKVLAALLQFLSELGAWIKDTAAPQMLAFGRDLGAALVRGFATALAQLGPVLDDAIKANPLLRIALSGLPGGSALLPENRAAVAGTAAAAGPAIAAAAREAGRVHVEIRGIELVVGVDPRTAAKEAGAEVEARVFEALTGSAAATDPGADPTLQGTGR